MADTEGISKLPNTFVNVLNTNNVLRNIPPFDLARQNKLCFELPFVFEARFPVGSAVIFLTVEADNFFQRFVGSIDVFVLHIENRIDAVLAKQQAKTVLKPEAGQQSAIMQRVLAVDIELRRPPAFGSVFEFGPITNERVDTSCPSDHRIGGDFQVTRFFHVVVVGDKVGPFLGETRRGNNSESENNENGDAKDHNHSNLRPHYS